MRKNSNPVIFFLERAQDVCGIIRATIIYYDDFYIFESLAQQTFEAFLQIPTRVIYRDYY